MVKLPVFTLLFNFPLCSKNSVSVASVVTGLQAGQLGVRISLGAKDLGVFQNVKTASKAHPASY
jgi:hypothetical protein